MLSEKSNCDFQGKIKNHQRLNYDILDGMVDWVRVVNKDGIVIYANKTMQEGLGRKILGERCYECLGKKHPCSICVTDKTIKTGKVAEKEEIVGDRIFAVKSSPVKDINGEIYAAVEVFRDVTKEKKLENEIVKKNQKMSKDLQFARNLQEKILPQKGIYSSLKVDFLYKPSEILGGDMFDIFNIDEDQTGIYISDVAGHGVSASMMTMFIRQTMRAIKDTINSPGEVLSELHRRFLDLNLDNDNYFTIFYGIINNKTNTFKYANGGHNCMPMLIRDNDIKFLESKDFPITYLFDSISYSEKEILLAKGDKILFYTDGIIEARDSFNNEFGIERLIDIIKGNKSNNLLYEVDIELKKFAKGTQKDDFAMVLIEQI